MRASLLPGCLILLVSVSAHARPDGVRLQLATGAQFSSGEYGELEQTEALVIPVYIRVGTGRWSLQASLPWVNARGPQALSELIDDNGGLGSNSGSGGASSGSGSGSDDDPDEPDDDDPSPDAPGSADRRVSGPGDASLTLGYTLDSIGDSPVYLEMRGRVRFPTGSEAEGLGTGTTDYALLGEIGVAGRRGGAYLNGGRRLLGSVAGLDRVDGWQAGAGAWWNVSPRAVLGINYDWRNASLRGGEAPRFAEAYAAWYLSDVWKLEVNGGVGLSDASADHAFGFTLSWRNIRRKAD